MNPEPGTLAPPGPVTAAGARDERVSTLVGDRVCVSCGFNLCGQPVLRERHYRMLIVRCPECSMVAALQEYPLLGRWANRWAALLGAAWMLVLVGALFASAGILFAMSLGTGGMASTRYAEHIAREQSEWDKSLDETQKAAFPAWVRQQLEVTQAHAGTLIQPTWWDGVDHAAMFRAAGGWGGAVVWSALWMWVWVLVVCSAFGAFYSVALLGVRRKRLLVLSVALPALSGLFALLAFTGESQNRAWMGMYMASEVAQGQIAPGIIALTLVFALPCLWVGAWLGRPLARAGVKILLPARLRPPLSILWTAEGLEPPRGGMTPR